MTIPDSPLLGDIEAYLRRPEMQRIARFQQLFIDHDLAIGINTDKPGIIDLRAGGQLFDCVVTYGMTFSEAMDAVEAMVLRYLTTMGIPV